ncbi:hypothetical protein Dimus_031734 [Dionaea muscipula]
MSRSTRWSSWIQEHGLVYAGGSDGHVMGWAAGKQLDSAAGGWNWELVFETRAHEMAALCMCIVGEYVCSGSADKSICVWKRDRDGSGLHRVGILRGHRGPVKCLQASSSCVGGGFLLYSGSLDKSLRVWWVPIEEG